MGDLLQLVQSYLRDTTAPVYVRLDISYPTKIIGLCYQPRYSPSYLSTQHRETLLFACYRRI